MHTGMPFIYLNLMKAEIQCLISCLALASECNDTQMGKTQSQKQDLSLHHLQIGKTNKIMFSIVCYRKFLVKCKCQVSAFYTQESHQPFVFFCILFQGQNYFKIPSFSIPFGVFKMTMSHLYIHYLQIRVSEQSREWLTSLS